MRKVFKKYNVVLNVFSGTIMMILILMTVADIILRKWFGIPFSGSYELTMIMLLLIVLFSFGHANDNKEHVVIDIFYRKFPQKMQWFCSMLVVVLTLVMTATLTFVLFRRGIRYYDIRLFFSEPLIPQGLLALIGSFGAFGYFLSAVNDFIHVFIERKVLTCEPN